MSFPNEIILSKPEIYILISIMHNHAEFGSGVQKYIISENLKSVDDDNLVNFLDFKLNLNIERLRERKLIDRSDDYHEPAYAITSLGKNWLFENEHRLQELLSNEAESAAAPIAKKLIES